MMDGDWQNPDPNVAPAPAGMPEEGDEETPAADPNAAPGMPGEEPPTA